MNLADYKYIRGLKSDSSFAPVYYDKFRSEYPNISAKCEGAITIIREDGVKFVIYDGKIDFVDRSKFVIIRCFEDDKCFDHMRCDSFEDACCYINNFKPSEHKLAYRLKNNIFLPVY